MTPVSKLAVVMDECARLRAQIDGIRELFPEYRSYRILADEKPNTLRQKISQLIFFRNMHEGAVNACTEENKRLWHLIRSLTGDETLELPRQKIYTTAPDGTQIKTDGDYDTRFYPF